MHESSTSASPASVLLRGEGGDEGGGGEGEGEGAEPPLPPPLAAKESASATATTPATHAATAAALLRVAGSPSSPTASAYVNRLEAVDRIVFDVTEVRASDALKESCAPNQSGATTSAARQTARSRAERRGSGPGAPAAVAAGGMRRERARSMAARSLLFAGEKSGAAAEAGELPAPSPPLGCGGGAAGGPGGEGEGGARRGAEEEEAASPAALLLLLLLLPPSPSSSARGPSLGLGTSGNEASSASSESLGPPPPPPVQKSSRGCPKFEEQGPLLLVLLLLLLLLSLARRRRKYAGRYSTNSEFAI